MSYTPDISVADPVFLRQGDLRRLGTVRNPDIELCAAMEKVIPNKVAGAQATGGLWLLYATNSESRVTLLTEGINISGHLLRPADKNPYTDEPLTERILFKDIPLTVKNDTIREYLASHQQIEQITDVMYEKIRDSYAINTQYNSGTRYVIVKAEFSPPLPKTADIGGAKCKIWHRSQTTYCQRCKIGAHKTSQTNLCPNYMDNPDVVCFKSPSHPLSNFHMCDITMDGVTYDSAEHCYQFLKMNYLERHTEAQQVLAAITPQEAKGIAARIDIDEKLRWENVKNDAMVKVLHAKAQSYGRFVQTLLNTGQSQIAECVNDNYWGTGLNPTLTAKTNPRLYSGPRSNVLGKMLQELRAWLIKSTTRDAETVPEQQQQEAATEASAPGSAAAAPIPAPTPDTGSIQQNVHVSTDDAVTNTEPPDGAVGSHSETDAMS